MNKSIVEFAVWAAIIVAVTLSGRWAFSVDTYAQEGGSPTPTVTPTSLLDEEGDSDEEEKREDLPDCTDPGNAGYPECSGYRTPTPTPEPTPTMRPGECNPFDDDCSPPQRPTATKVPGNSCPPHQTCVTPEPTEETEDDAPTPTPKDTPTPCSTGGGSAKDSESTSRCVTPTPRSGGGNPNPVVNPSQAFAVTVLQRDQPIESSRWEYYERHLIEVRISTTSDSVRMEDYNFMLDLNSEQTGIYMVRAGPGNATCDENRLGDTETNTVDGPNIFLLGIRCGLGEPGGYFEVRAQRDNSGNSPMFSIGRTGAIPQPWHLLDGRANYYFQIADPVGSRVYGIPPEYYYDGAAALLEQTTRAAGLEWELKARVPIFHVGPPYDFVVKTFWATRNPCPTGWAYACVVPFQSGDDPT